MFTPLTSMVMPMADQGEEGNREDAKSARSSHHGRGDGSGEEAAGVRDGREARPFFDPKRGQLGANFSGGTGLTRPPGILTGTHIAAITSRYWITISPRRPRATRRWYHRGSKAAPASPRRRCIAPGCRDKSPND